MLLPWLLLRANSFSWGKTRWYPYPLRIKPSVHIVEPNGTSPCIIGIKLSHKQLSTSAQNVASMTLNPCRLFFS